MASRRSPDPPVLSPAPPRRTLSAKPGAVPRARAALTPEARHAMIAENAYLRAERRGFARGREAEDWLAAEAEVDALLKISYGGSPQ